jgi:hypothetical protein
MHSTSNPRPVPDARSRREPLRVGDGGERDGQPAAMKDPAARAQEALEEVDAHHGRRLVTSSAAASEPRPLRRLLGRAPKPPEPEPYAAP